MAKRWHSSPRVAKTDSANPMSVVFDVQGVQSRIHGERGIARYLTELAAALEEWFPGAVDRYLVNPGLPVAQGLDVLPPSERLGTVNDLPAAARVYHLGSPFELGVSIDELWPPAARSLRLVITLYDLIPELFPETYMTDPRTRRRYRTRLELVRRADRLLAISRATAEDAVERLRLPKQRVVVVGAAAASRFRRPPSREAAFATLEATMPEIEPEFLLYTGGIEPRKNIDRLLTAYAGLTKNLKEKHQLVIVCRLLPEERTRLEETLRELGVAERVHFTGYVSDQQLVSLYGATALFVFPSLYEGYGLPVAEAVACGAAVVASDTSSLVELVLDEQARFDPHDVESIRSTMTRCLTEQAMLEHLRRPESYALDSWREVAQRTVDVYKDLEARPKIRRSRSRPRVAYVSPLPPQRSGVADYSYRLLTALGQLCDVDGFVDASLGHQEGPPGVQVSGLGAFEIVERLRGGYDEVFICLGNSEHHIAALDLLRRRGGTVLAHDVRLTGMYGYASLHRPELEPRSMEEILREMYGATLPAGLGRGGLRVDEAHAHDIYMTREAIRLADWFVVHSHYAAQLARHDSAPEDRRKVRVAPFGVPDPSQFSGFFQPEMPVIGTFGIVAPEKQTEKVVDAFSVVFDKRRECVLVVAGPPAGPGVYERLRARVDELQLGDRVRLIGELDDKAFRRAVAQATVAVQLRAMSMGESPASVADCMAAGVPTVVTAVGAARELPDEAVVKVGPDIPSEALGQILVALLDDVPRRASMRAAGKRFAKEHSFERAAEFLYTEFVLGEGRAAA
jgi:glycosyltransferase involved in cell wall biosynthesis